MSLLLSPGLMRTMHSTAQPVPGVGVLAAMLVVIVGCTSARNGAPEPDLSRLDRCLQDLVYGRGGQCEYVVHGTGEEARYSVVIRTDDPEALEAFGIPTGSRLGPIVTARVTLAQLKQLSSIRGVIVVENPDVVNPTNR